MGQCQRGLGAAICRCDGRWRTSKLGDTSAIKRWLPDTHRSSVPDNTSVARRHSNRTAVASTIRRYLLAQGMFRQARPKHATDGALAAHERLEPYLLGVIGDRSRLVCHLQWYLDEAAHSLVHGLCQAFMKRGLPRALMTDNGAAMLADETVSGLASLGIVHQTTLPYVWTP